MIKGRRDHPSKGKRTSKEVMLFNFTFATGHCKISHSWVMTEADEGHRL